MPPSSKQRGKLRKRRSAEALSHKMATKNGALKLAPQTLLRTEAPPPPCPPRPPKRVLHFRRAPLDLQPLFLFYFAARPNQVVVLKTPGPPRPLRRFEQCVDRPPNGEPLPFFLSQICLRMFQPPPNQRQRAISSATVDEKRLRLAVPKVLRSKEFCRVTTYKKCGDPRDAPSPP
jgi:hypothetical protein